MTVEAVLYYTALLLFSEWQAIKIVDVVFLVMTLSHSEVFTSVMEEPALPIFKVENEASRFLQNVIKHLQD
jgi:hypothetical protein